MSRDDAGSNVQSRKPIRQDQVADKLQRQTLCFLYNNVERPLSLALQPGTTPINIIRLVTDARDKLRIAMKKMGWLGQF